MRSRPCSPAKLNTYYLNKETVHHAHLFHLSVRDHCEPHPNCYQKIFNRRYGHHRLLDSSEVDHSSDHRQIQIRNVDQIRSDPLILFSISIGVKRSFQFVGNIILINLGQVIKIIAIDRPGCQFSIFRSSGDKSGQIRRIDRSFPS